MTHIVKNEELNNYESKTIICSSHPKRLTMITKFYIGKLGLESITSFTVTKNQIPHYTGPFIQEALDAYNSLY